MTDQPDSSPPLRIALTRHGQTDWNAAGRLQGSSDVPLNATGRAQAVDSASRFAGGDWGSVATSPLGRAAETGAIIAEAIGVAVLGVYTDLRERDYGDAEGLSDAEAMERWPDGGYPRLESRDSVARRGLRAIDAIADESAHSSVIVVAHGTLIREILRRMTPTPVPPILNAATSLVERTGEAWRVITINDERVRSDGIGGIFAEINTETTPPTLRRVETGGANR